MNYNRKDTIASLATTPGISAISIIRISGEDLSLLFSLITNKKTFKNRYASYCTIFDQKKKIILDQCIIIYYANPNSYTGEDVIEINCHGGHIVSQKILNMLYTHGVKPAHPGEFSYRAFLNNKIDLIEAETISNIINSSSEYSHDIIIDNLNNSLRKNILEINKEIIDILSIIEHELDFSEDEIDYITNESILNIVDNIIDTVNGYLNNQNLVKTMNTGIDIVIMGVPNAGKSSLFNKIIGYDRTIVSSREGTTRDSIETKLIINQYPVNLIDTAGYFDTDDQINIDSIKQTMKYAKNADIIIYLDEDTPVNKYQLLNLTCDNVVFCKSKRDTAKKNVNKDGSLNISSKTNYGINLLYDELSTILLTDYKYDFNNDSTLISQRQINIFQEASIVLDKIKIMLEEEVGMDVIASHMHELTDLFDECLGKVSNDTVLQSIFSTFCVGK